MNQQNGRMPAPIVGVLSPGEKRTRKFGPLPDGVMPILQNFPHGTVSLVEQSVDSMTIENKGPTRAGFSILFITQGQLEKLVLSKQLVNAIAPMVRKKVKP